MRNVVVAVDVDVDVVVNVGGVVVVVTVVDVDSNVYGKIACIRKRAAGRVRVGFQCDLGPKPDSPYGPLLTRHIQHMSGIQVTRSICTSCKSWFR